ncbi:MAG TPA: DUF3333 domain-containing protein, partial [Allosphingosinicella sp.]|nr:DUF3333 domain-containing protein [Allosphingosinicella sp.]
MSDRAVDPTPTDWNSEAIQRRIRKRYAAERRFRLVGLAAVMISAGFLAFLLITMMANGLRGFTQTEVRVDLDSRAVAMIAAGDFEGALGEEAGLLSSSGWLRLRDS